MINEYALFNSDTQMPEGGVVIIVDAWCLESFVADCARLLNEPEDRFHGRIAEVSFYPLSFIR